MSDKCLMKENETVKCQCNIKFIWREANIMILSCLYTHSIPLTLICPEFPLLPFISFLSLFFLLLFAPSLFNFVNLVFFQLQHLQMQMQWCEPCKKLTSPLKWVWLYWTYSVSTARHLRYVSWLTFLNCYYISQKNVLFAVIFFLRISLCGWRVRL